MDYKVSIANKHEKQKKEALLDIIYILSTYDHNDNKKIKV